MYSGVCKVGSRARHVQGDLMLSVQAIEKGNMNYLEVGNLIQDCLKTIQIFLFLFLGNKLTQVAHLIARVSSEIDCFHNLFSQTYFVLESLSILKSFNKII